MLLVYWQILRIVNSLFDWHFQLRKFANYNSKIPVKFQITVNAKLWNQNAFLVWMCRLREVHIKMFRTCFVILTLIFFLI